MTQDLTTMSGEELLPCPFCGTSDHLSMIFPGSMTGDMPARPAAVICTHIDHDVVQGPTAYGKHEAAAAWNRRLASPAVGAIPGGYRLVPVEPQPEMVAAWWRVKNGHHFADEPPPSDTSDYAAYRALLSAAPSPLGGWSDKCTCLEVFGEDPACRLHGNGTAWAEENPDFCDDKPPPAPSQGEG